jgi:hypothetical protein
MLALLRALRYEVVDIEGAPSDAALAKFDPPWELPKHF